AGFYSQDLMPIGLFMNEEGILAKWRQNRLFNGVVSINHLDVPRITDVQPRDILRVGLQTGPLLVENAEYKDVQGASDMFDRRVVAFTTGENRLYFSVFYDKNSVFSGPTL